MLEIFAGKHGYKAQLASAAGCQRSYLSQVLGATADLLPEHVVGLSEFWNLSPTETDYFLNMLLFARASNERTRKHFKEKLLIARKDQENLVKRFTEKVVLPDEQAAIFYSSWQYLAITIALSIPECRTVASLSLRLSLTETVVRKALADLEKIGMVYNSGGTWIPANTVIHLPRESRFNAINHSHWRNKAVENAFLNDEEAVHYTSLCTLTRADADKIKELVLQLIDESRKIVAPSKEEELFCLTCDWFKI